MYDTGPDEDLLSTEQNPQPRCRARVGRGALRDLPALSHGARILPEAAIKNLRITEIVGDLPLPRHDRALDSGNARLYLETILTSYNVVLTHR